MLPGQPLKLLKDTYDLACELRELEWLHKRVNEIFTVGPIALSRTLTPAGTTGNQTINKLAGTVNMAAGSSVLVVTNSFADANSLIFCSIRTNDATAQIKNVVPGDGFFTITLSAAATAETSIGFVLFN